MRRFSFLCRDPIIFEASIPEYAIFPVHAFFPVSAIVKLILLDGVDCKASMPVPDYQNVEMIATIPKV